MATNANAIAEVSAQVGTPSEPTGTNANPSKQDENPRDEFGRTASERTVELRVADAEAVNSEVAAGKHDTYDDALAYIIERGLAEIKRQRATLAKTADAKRLAANAKTWAALLKLNPALVTDPKVMARYAEEMTPRV